MNYRHSLLGASLLWYSVLITSAMAVDEPYWWRNGEMPVLSRTAEANDRGVASIGQLKWMVKSALTALDGSMPGTAAEIRAELIGPGKTIPSLDVPSPATAAWFELQKGALTVGQLKAVGLPFYKHLHQNSPKWLLSQRVLNGTFPPTLTLDSSGNYPAPYQKYPWTSTTSDDSNSSPATIGQLKSLFALRFESYIVDSDGNGLPDGWELETFGGLGNDGFADSDGDGYTNFEELALGTDPLVVTAALTDTDGDGMPDVYEESNHLNSNADDSFEDADGDRVPNLFEYRNGTWALNSASVPHPTFLVDNAKGAAGLGGRKFATIQGALDKAMYPEWPDGATEPPAPNAFCIIEVKAGVYPENLYVANVPVLVLGELGSSKGPVTISGKDAYAALSIQSASAFDGLVITHRPGVDGRGVEAVYFNMDSPVSVVETRRKLTNCIIHGNGVTNGGGIFSFGSLLSVSHCTIRGNICDQDGSGISLSDGHLELSNSIVWGNTDGQTNRQVTLQNGASLSIPSPSQNIIGSTNSLGLTGWIDGVDPKLTPADWLKWNSPAIGAGRETAVSSTKFDLNGERRSHLPISDLGADEYRDFNQIADGDGVPDWAEAADDNDGISALDEYEIYGTNPTLTDTDGDGMSDGDELANHFDPRVSEDGDSDGMPDAWEFMHGLDPLVDDSMDDLDGDRVPNIYEFIYGTTPDDVASVPAATFEVDPATGGHDPADRIYSTINDALNAAAQRDQDGKYGADPYPIIFVHGGVYPEKLELYDIPMLLLAELGAPSGAVQLVPDQNGTTLTISSASVVDGFVISHSGNASGTGVSVEGGGWGEPARRKLINCMVKENQGFSAGGIDANSCDLDLVHCSVIENSTIFDSGGINLYEANLKLANSIVSSNIGSTATAPQIEVGANSGISVMAGASSIVSDVPATPTPGWISGDPGLRVNGYIANRWSAAVDQGGLLSGTKVLSDIQGQARATGGIPDIGADELVAGVDSDGDGMPDSWEERFGLATLDPKDAMADKDGDRVPNLWEYERGTSPAAADSHPLADWVVDSSLSATGTNVVSSIQEAIDLAPVLGPDSSLFTVIEVRSGTYPENLLIPANKKIALLGHLGFPSPEIQAPANNLPAVRILGQSVVDGFRITRAKPSAGFAMGSAPGVSIAASSSNPVSLINLVICGQRAETGAGVYLESGRVNLLQSTIYDTSAATFGSGVAVLGSSDLTLTNCIVRGAASPAPQQIYKATSAVVSLTGSFVRDGGFGGSATDPLLTSAGLLRKGSPAIDAGVPGNIAHDIQDDPRVGVPDAGADEFVDSDNDGLQDWLEAIGVTSPAGDLDNDGLTNLAEYETYGTDPSDPDSDDDGMPDGWEVQNGLDPLSNRDAMADNDGDRIPNLWEFKRGTSPSNATSRPAADRVVNPAILGNATVTETIQKAIDLAPSNRSKPDYYQIIEVSSGVYAEDLVIPGGKKIVLLGAAGYPLTEIRGTSENETTLSVRGMAFVDGFRINRTRVPGRVPSTNSRGVEISVSDDSRQVSLSNMVIQSHEAAEGAGIHLDAGSLYLTHATVYDPVGDRAGSPVFLAEGTRMTIANSIIRGSGGSSIPQIQLATHAEVNASGSLIRFGALGANSADPLLTPEGFLSSGSPAINQGVVLNGARDVHGETRTGNPDSGADEFRDSDHDGLPDWLENLGLVPANGDADSDGFSEAEEYFLNRENYNALDSDGDGLDDGEETYVYKTSVTNSDTDGDRVSDWTEVRKNRTNPLDGADDDADGIGDDLEFFVAREIIRTSTNPPSGAIGDALLEGDLDPDYDYTGDGLTASEYAAQVTDQNTPPAAEPLINFDYQNKSIYLIANEGPWGRSGTAEIRTWLHSGTEDAGTGSFPYDAVRDAAGLYGIIAPAQWAPVGTGYQGDIGFFMGFEVSRSDFWKNETPADNITASYQGNIVDGRGRAVAEVPLEEDYRHHLLKVTTGYLYFGEGYQNMLSVPSFTDVGLLTYEIPKGRLASPFLDFIPRLADEAKYSTKLYQADLDIIDPYFGKMSEFAEDQPGALNIYQSDENPDESAPLTELVLRGGYPTGAAFDKIRLKFDGGDKFKIYADQELTQEVVSELTEFTAASNTTVYVKGLKKGEATDPPRTILEQIAVYGVWCDGDSVNGAVTKAFDLDVDSDNSGMLDANAQEEVIESDPAKPGKVMLFDPVALPDVDGIPDSLDGLEEIQIQTLDRPGSTIKFSYSGCDPTESRIELDAYNHVVYRHGPGTLRLWKKGPQGLPTEYADYIEPEHAYLPEDLGIEPGGSKRFFIQAVDFKIPRQSIKVTMEVPGSEDPVATDTVVVTVLSGHPAPSVLDVNSDFDEGRLDPVTGFAIPDCYDSDKSLVAERTHLDGKFKKGQIVTDDLHQGIFGVSPTDIPDELAAGATITIRKVDLPDAEFGGKQEGQVRFYAIWTEGGVQKVQAIETYDSTSYVGQNLNGLVYGPGSTIPKDAVYWMEGTAGGKITLEWKLTKGTLERRFRQEFLVATQLTKEEWNDEIAYEIRLESSDDVGGVVDIRNFGTTGSGPNVPPFAAHKEELYEMYDYYRELFLQNYGVAPADRDEVMAWYGLARCTTGEIVGGLTVMEDAFYFTQGQKNAGLPMPVDPLSSSFAAVMDYLIRNAPGQLVDIQEALMVGARDIFLDLAWQGRAYRASGIYGLKYVNMRGTNFRYDGWKKIDLGRRYGNVATIRDGVKDLADREQNITVQPAFNMLSAIEVLPSIPIDLHMNDVFSLMSENTVPGGASFLDVMGIHGNVADPVQRWDWVLSPHGVIPSFYTKTPLQHQQLNQEYIEVRSRGFLPRLLWPGEERLLETEWQNDRPTRYHGPVYSD